MNYWQLVVIIIANSAASLDGIHYQNLIAGADER
jgi:hypothetical protein